VRFTDLFTSIHSLHRLTNSSRFLNLGLKTFRLWTFSSWQVDFNSQAATAAFEVWKGDSFARVVRVESLKHGEAWQSMAQVKRPEPIPEASNDQAPEMSSTCKCQDECNHVVRGKHLGLGSLGFVWAEESYKGCLRFLDDPRCYDYWAIVDVACTAQASTVGEEQPATLSAVTTSDKSYKSITHEDSRYWKMYDVCMNGVTSPKFNSSPLKSDAWKTTFLLGPGNFSGSNC